MPRKGSYILQPNLLRNAINNHDDVNGPSEPMRVSIFSVQIFRRDQSRFNEILRWTLFFVVTKAVRYDVCYGFTMYSFG